MNLLKLFIDSAKYIRKTKNSKKRFVITNLNGNTFEYKGFHIYISDKNSWVATDYDSIKLTGLDLQEIFKKIDNFD